MESDFNPVKLIYVVILACMLVGYAIYRWIHNMRVGNYSAKLIKALDASPGLADEVATDYQNQYAKVPDGEFISIQKRLAHMQTGQVVLKKYEILGRYPLQKDGLLLVTLCRNTEIGERGGDVIKKYHFNFVVQHKPATKEVEVCSDYFEILSDKFLREDFAKYVAKELEKKV